MNQINDMLVTYVTNALWMTCIITAIASLLSRALGRCPSAYRHALWVAALLLAVVVPFASFGVPPNNYKHGPEAFADARPLPSAEKGLSGTSSWVLWRQIRHGAQPVLFRTSLVGFVAVLYVGCIFYRSVRLWCGLRSLRAVLQTCSQRQIPPGMLTVIRQCHSLVGLKPLPILWSSEGKGPATLGIRNPVLVLPEWFLTQASTDELRSTLSHELAHIRRNDFVLNLVYEFLVLPISFHPASALIKRRIDQSRELACDEIAAEWMDTRAQYARSLLSIARSVVANQHSAKVEYAVGLFDTDLLEGRIMNVIAKANRIPKARAQASAVATVFLLLVACLGLSGFSIRVGHPTGTDADLQQFVGTWHASFKGKIFLTINLEKQQDGLTGTASHAEVQVDKQGELTSAEEHDGSDPIAAKLTGGILEITIREQDSEDTIQCEMKLTGADQAELRVITPAPDVSAPKPWKLERVKASQEKP